MQRIPVSSSNVCSVGYDPQRHVLEVEFKGGGVYQYAGVPAEAHRALMAAPSVGSHIARHIKGAYPHARVNPKD